jgi:hypothetical protein
MLVAVNRFFIGYVKSRKDVETIYKGEKNFYEDQLIDLSQHPNLLLQ